MHRSEIATRQGYNMAFNSNLIGQVEQALTRVLRAGPGIRDTHDSANAIIDVLRKLRIARELSDRYYIAVTGSQSAGKTRLMRELYNLGKDWLFDDQGRGERVPVFIIEDDSIDAPYGAVQSVENGEVVEKRLEAKDFRDLTTSWSETSCDLLPKLYVPRKFFSGSNVGFVLLWSTTVTGFAVMWPCAHAHCITACILCLVRLAVSALVSQMGRSTSAQSPGLTASSFRFPSLGKT